MAIIRIIFILLICSVSFAQPLKFGIASIVPEGTPDYALNDFYSYLSGKLGREIEPVMENSYENVDSKLANNEVDFASVCSTAFSSKGRIRIIAIPEINGRHSYKTYIIVNKKFGIKKVTELKNKTFAFTDKLTGSGSLYPSYLIISTFKQLPEEVLKKTFYTQSNEQSIYLVNKGVVDAAAVDGAVFDEYQKNNPKQTTSIEVIHRSPEVIAPPFVASPSMDEYTYNRLKSILLNMDDEIEGRIVLGELSIDRFVPARYRDYENLIRIRNTVEKFKSGAK
ncbi:MAG: PhnD/SsuA/transferrin family substrate-binding protein [Deferribacterales bacterium]